MLFQPKDKETQISRASSYQNYISDSVTSAEIDSALILLMDSNDFSCSPMVAGDERVTSAQTLVTATVLDIDIRRFPS